MTIIRDINGNKQRHTLRHYLNNSQHSGAWHTDSTGLFIVDYTDNRGNGFAAFIRPETAGESNAVAVAKQLGPERT